MRRAQWNDFLVDYSKNLLNETTFSLLQDLVVEVNLKQAIISYFGGEHINQTENRAVLHTALRANENEVVLFEGKNIILEIFETKNKIKDFFTDINIMCVNKYKNGFTWTCSRTYAVCYQT